MSLVEEVRTGFEVGHVQAPGASDALQSFPVALSPMKPFGGQVAPASSISKCDRHLQLVVVERLTIGLVQNMSTSS